MTDLERKWFGTGKEAKKVYSLGDFRRASADMHKALGEAYNTAIRLKGMWDSFEAIPEKQQPLYDQTMKVIRGLAKPGSNAYNVAIKLKRYR